MVTMKAKIFIYVIAGVIVGMIFSAALKKPQEVYVPPENIKPEPTSTTTENTPRIMSIEDYVKQNISTLSPEKETVGGKFFVTEIQTTGNTGVVKYEDGHNAYVADFTFTTSETGHKINSFIIRK